MEHGTQTMCKIKSYIYKHSFIYKFINTYTYIYSVATFLTSLSSLLSSYTCTLQNMCLVVCNKVEVSAWDVFYMLMLRNEHNHIY